ncbi:CUE domain-containing protein 2 [Pseudolycoriella hygida]|uniref:CUE domain-containing protein 2 n=1 Tax=Pseudolycoriella hygida TaxID=35572 RepID=A0A9Q0RYM9_9DIPT|nr:CUE domain-containing protein 2 [Pseudolycoriella hygida]
MANIEKQHEIVKTSLNKFVNEHISGADLSVVDEIVLAYVISILEEASQDPCFDIDGFIEMMSAYFPEFSKIDPASVCTWIFQLENQLSSLNKSAESQNLSLKSLSLSDIIPESKLRARPPSISDGVETSSNNAKRTQHLSETSDCGSTDSSGCDFFSDECDVLQEMFPESSFMEVKHCVTIANGDIDRATQILLDRQEAGQSLAANFTNLHAPKNQVIDDNELKNRIISRYSYVDKNAENKEYKPVIPKVEPKKLVRYRDNKIVSLKGERYTDVRRDEEAELKKPKKPICP